MNLGLGCRKTLGIIVGNHGEVSTAWLLRQSSQGHKLNEARQADQRLGSQVGLRFWRLSLLLLGEKRLTPWPLLSWSLFTDALNRRENSSWKKTSSLVLVEKWVFLRGKISVSCTLLIIYVFIFVCTGSSLWCVGFSCYGVRALESVGLAAQWYVGS